MNYITDPDNDKRRTDFSFRSNRIAQIIDSHSFLEPRRRAGRRLPAELHRDAGNGHRKKGQQYMVPEPDVRPAEAYAAAELAHRHCEARKRMAESPVQRSGGERQDLRSVK